MPMYILPLVFITFLNYRSVTYYARERMCKLSSETRRTKPESFRKSGPDVDYMENECAQGIRLRTLLPFTHNEKNELRP